MLRSALPLSPSHTARCIRVFGYLGIPSLLHHLVACSLLLPERFLDPGAPSAALARLTELLRARCRLLFVSLPSSIEPAHIESRQEREAQLALAYGIVGVACTQDVEPAPSPHIVGELEGERVGAMCPELEAAPLGSAIPWIFATELMGTEIAYGATRSDAPGSYRAALTARLAALSEQSPEIFARALVSGDEPELRRHLDVLCDALRGVASIEGVAAV